MYEIQKERRPQFKITTTARRTARNLEVGVAFLKLSPPSPMRISPESLGTSEICTQRADNTYKARARGVAWIPDLSSKTEDTGGGLLQIL